MSDALLGALIGGLLALAGTVLGFLATLGIRALDLRHEVNFACPASPSTVAAMEGLTVSAATAAPAGSLAGLDARIAEMAPSPPKPAPKRRAEPRRRGARAPLAKPPEPTPLELLRAQERVLAERVGNEQRRTGKQRPQCFAFSLLEVVRIRIADLGSQDGSQSLREPAAPEPDQV